MENYSTFVSEHLDQDVLPHSHKPTKSIDGEDLGRLCRLYLGCSESICQIISSSPSIERLQRPRSKGQKVWNVMISCVLQVSYSS